LLGEALVTLPNEDDAARRYLARAEDLLRQEADATSGADEAQRTVGGYRLIRRLGYGGMGVVWLAEDVAMRRRVAIKFLAPHMTFDPEAVWRFGQEAAAAARLDHPGIVAVHSLGTEDEERYFVMEFVDGVPIHRLLMRLAGLRPHEISLGAAVAALDAESEGMGSALTHHDPPAASYIHAVAGWIAQASTAVAHAHSRGVLHRDLKPSNLILDRSGRIRIVDFGLARIEEQATMTRTEAVMGTLAYVAPEIVTRGSARAEPRSDLYSLGVVLFELLALRPPFVGDSYQLLRDIADKPSPSIRAHHRGVPRDLDCIVQRAVAKEPAERYATGEDFAADLRRFLGGEAVRARPIGLARRARSWARRHPVGTVMIAVALAAFVAFWPVTRGIAAARIAREAGEERRIGEERLASYTSTREQLERERSELSIAISQRAVRSGEGSGYLLWNWERKLRDLEARLARCLEEARGAIERAARIEASAGAMSRETQDAFARYYLFRYEVALAEHDEVAADVYRDAVRAHDPSASLSEDLEGPATLTLTVTPSDAELFLFRYESHDSLCRGPLPRLVPVPTRGRGRCRDGEWAPGFVPGEPCLVVRSVAQGSPAGDAGIEPGDLVLRIGIKGAGHGLFVTAVRPGSLADKAGVRPWDRVGSVGGVNITSPGGWRSAANMCRERAVFLQVGAVGFTVAQGEDWDGRVGVDVKEVDGVLSSPSPAGGGTLDLLHKGEPVRLYVPPGVAPGITSELTAYPLILSPSNRLAHGSRIDIAAGSYLVFARRPDHEDQLYPVLVPRRSAIERHVTLQRAGTTPPGFVWVPGGAFRSGGDPDLMARDPSGLNNRLEEKVVPGFFILRREVTLGEWFEFVNAPETLRKIEDARLEGRTVYLPRHYNAPYLFADRLPDGRYAPQFAADVPVFGISATDIEDFLRWHNARSVANGDAWLWAMPEPDQWEKAARGVDGRFFPWGNRYESTFVGLGEDMDCARPCFSEARDVSPFGVADLGGSRREWVTGGALRGGSWGDGDVKYFRSSHQDWTGTGYFNQTCGFRPVLKPNAAVR